MLPATRSEGKQQRLADKVDARLFADEDVRDFLNKCDVSTIIGKYGAPDDHITKHAEAKGWQTGDGRPALASDDPAVMQAIGRCAADRSRQTLKAPVPFRRSVHPSPCAWCDYPTDELLKACAWAVHQSAFVTADVFVWRNNQGHTYARPGSLTGYQRKEWREFWALPEKERERRIEAASGRKPA